MSILHWTVLEMISK